MLFVAADLNENVNTPAGSDLAPEYVRKHDFRIDDFIEATASGQASEKRRRLDELMNVLQRGDRLVVSELSRLGRSLGQIVAILDAIAKAGVAFVAMKENIRIEGQRDLISERTREGLAKRPSIFSCSIRLRMLQACEKPLG